MSVPQDRVSRDEALRVGGMAVPKEYLPQTNNDGARVQHSLIVRRERKRFLPNNNQSPSINIGGSSPSSQTDVNIPLQLGGALLDTPSTCLNYNLKLTSSDANGLPFIENASMPWRKIKVQAGGVDIETWDYHAQQLQRNKEGSMSRDYAQAQYSYMNDIRDRVASLSGITSTAVVSSDAAFSVGSVNDLAEVAGSTYSDLLAGINVSLKLFHMGFFSQRAYYPLGLAPINLVAESNETVGGVLCIGGTAALAAGTGLVVSNISASAVCPIPSQALMRRYQEVQRKGEVPFIMPIDTVQIQIRQAYSVSSDGTETNVSFNVARYHLKDLRYWLQYRGQLTNANELKTAAPSFLSAGADNKMDLQVDVGGRAIPQDQLRTDVEVYNATCESYNTEDSVSHPNLLPRNAYASTQFTSTDLAGKYVVGSCQFGLNLSEYLGDQGSRTGIDLVQNSAINLRGKFGYPSAGSATDYNWFQQARFCRVLQLQGGVLQATVNA